MVEITVTEQNIEKRMTKKKYVDHQRDLWDSIKCANICSIGGPSRRREKGPEKIFEEVIAENVPNMGKETVNQVQEAQRVPGRMNPRMNTLRYTVIKLTKIKDKYKILNAIGEKWQITFKGTPIKIPADFWTETLQARRESHDIFKLMKGKNLLPRILYPARLLFRFDGETENFPDKQK